MMYIYAAMFLHSAGKPITEENLKKIAEAVGIEYDEARIKALVAALSEVDIDEVIKSTMAMPVAAPAPAEEVKKEEEAKEEKKEEEKKEEKKEEEAVAGLAALFG